MGKRSRHSKPGQAQMRRMWFCIRLLGLGVVFLFITAILIGLPFPGIWQAVMAPFWMVYGVVVPVLTGGFFARGLWIKAKAKHYETLMKLETDPRFK